MFKKLTFLLAGAGLVILAACNTDKCKDKNCGTNGQCNIITGACDCTTGYEGADCSTLSRTKFLTSSGSATYTGSESCSGGAATAYSGGVVTFNPGVAANAVVISNFGDYGCTTRRVTANATVKGDSIFVTNSTDCTYTFNGKGKITTSATGASIVLSYTTATAGVTTTPPTCVVTLTR